jgi:hypothetical protein
MTIIQDLRLESFNVVDSCIDPWEHHPKLGYVIAEDAKSLD